MLFETHRLYVTKWKEGNLHSLFQLFNDSAIKEDIFPKLTVEETTQIFENQLKDYDSDYPFGRYFIVEKTRNDFIGLFLLKKNKEEGSVEIGYSLIKEHWKKGYATEVVQHSLKWLFEQEKFSRVYAITETDNVDSQHVLLKSGFCLQKNFDENGKEMNLFVLENN